MLKTNALIALVSVVLGQGRPMARNLPGPGDLPERSALDAAYRFLPRLDPSGQFGTASSRRIAAGSSPTARVRFTVSRRRLWNVQADGFEVYVDARSGLVGMASNGDWEFRHHSLRAQRLRKAAPAAILNPLAVQRGLEGRLRALIAPHEYRARPMTVHDDVLGVGLDRLLNGLPILDGARMASLVVDRATGEVVFFYQDAESPDLEPSVRHVTAAKARQTAHRRLPRAMASHPRETVVLGYATPKGGTRPRLAWRIHESYALQGMTQEVSVLVDAETGAIMDVIE